MDILGENIMGGACARVCPTEVLCEEACVRNNSEHKPVRIGALQRHATDWLFTDEDAALRAQGVDAASAWRWWAAGRRGCPARTGWRCSAMTVTVFEANAKLGGLNEYGIAAYKVAARLRGPRGGFHPEHRRHRRRSAGEALGRDFTLARSAQAL